MSLQINSRDYYITVMRLTNSNTFLCSLSDSMIRVARDAKAGILLIYNAVYHRS